MTDKNEIYPKLALHLDNLPGGFPATESGVELRILRKLFTPEDAHIALHLTLLPESPAVIAYRVGLSAEVAVVRLLDMSKRGLILRLEKSGKYKYMAAQFVVGIWEYQVNRLDQELIELFNEYVPELMTPESWKAAPQIRTIPVDEGIIPQHEVMNYDRAEQIVAGKKKFLVAPCICRREHNMIGEGCDKLPEACLIFDSAADFYEGNGIGRVITREETLAILHEGERQGLVVQPANGQNPVSMCLCCSCCCQVLKQVKNFPVPAEHTASSYVVALDSAACVGCHLCVEICPMQALTEADVKVALDTNRCIGCGLCVKVCAVNALDLELKSERPIVSKKYSETLLRLGKARGKMTDNDMAKLIVQSKLDRRQVKK